MGGVTHLSEQEVHQILTELSIEWHGSAYHILERNCTHFARTFAKRLGVAASLPDWVDRLGRTALSFVETYEDVGSFVNQLAPPSVASFNDEAPKLRRVAGKVRPAHSGPRLSSAPCQQPCFDRNFIQI